MKFRALEPSNAVASFSGILGELHPDIDLDSSLWLAIPPSPGTEPGLLR